MSECFNKLTKLTTLTNLTKLLEYGLQEFYECQWMTVWLNGRVKGRLLKLSSNGIFTDGKM